MFKLQSTRPIHALLLLCGLTLTACGGGPSETASQGQTLPELPMGCEPVTVPEGDFTLMGDPRACQGGEFTVFTNSYPTHLNFYGPERDATLARVYTEAFHNTLVAVHPNTLETVPELAWKWEEIDGGKEIVFHIDPDARWSDGKPVTADDVVATYDLIVHPDVVELIYKNEFDNMGMERPEKLDERTVKFVFKEPSWRNLLIFDDIYIMPAHATAPETFLEEWRFAVPVNSGPYTVGDYETGKYFSLKRRRDFWGEGKRQFIGTGNFDNIKFKIILDADIAYEHIKKGDIDFYLVTKAQRWAEETDIEKVERGWLQKTKMYMKQPEVPSQMAFNLEHPIFEDVRVRKALFYLYDREFLHDQLFYNQYVNKNSFWANSIYENPDNEKVTFSPEKGLALLNEAGWTQKDTDGILIKDGRRLEFEFIYIHPSAERVYTPIQESFRKYGVAMNLKMISPSAWIKLSEKKDFEVIYANWGSVPFPQPRNPWHSESAEIDGSSNITKFRDDRVDALIEQYEAEPDLQKRAELIREMDGIIYEQVPYLLDWYAPFFRLMWWDKFGFPEWISYSTLDIRQTHWKTWWYQPDRAARLERARAEKLNIPLYPEENTHWK